MPARVQSFTSRIPASVWSSEPTTAMLSVKRASLDCCVRFSIRRFQSKGRTRLHNTHGFMASLFHCRSQPTSEHRCTLHNSWHAVILVLDGQPFPELHSIVAEANDSRIWVFAEWIGSTYAAKTQEGFWAPHYHGYLYNLTDDAVLGRWCIRDAPTPPPHLDSRYLYQPSLRASVLQPALRTLHGYW